MNNHIKYRSECDPDFHRIGISEEHNRIVLLYIVAELVFFIPFLKSAFYLSMSCYFAFVLLASKNLDNFSFLILEEVFFIQCT